MVIQAFVFFVNTVNQDQTTGIISPMIALIYVTTLNNINFKLHIRGTMLFMI